MVDGVYTWPVIIPALRGIPNSLQESEWFQKYNDRNKKINDMKKDEQKAKNTKDVIYKFLYALKKKEKVEQLDDLSEEVLQYVTYATVCSTPGTIVNYNNGDIVVLGFKENKMSQPVILGLCQTMNSVMTPAFTIGSFNELVVNESAKLPSNTQIGVNYCGNTTQISTDDIYKAVLLVRTLEDAGITVDKLRLLVGMIGSLQTILGSSLIQGILGGITQDEEENK